MPRALISVSDKSELVPFATALLELGWEIVASGGTEKILRESGLDVTSVEHITNIPEMLNGRVKTLHPAIHAGILMRDRQEDIDSLNEMGYAPISLVVCNLYPFHETVSRANVTLQDALENIDVGGVTLLRAAAKNFFRVIAVCDTNDYPKVLAGLKASGEVDLAVRRQLAVKAFAHTRDYDTAIHAFLSNSQSQSLDNTNGELPQQLSLGIYQIEKLSYGENPHQSAAYYSQHATDTPLGATQLGGKQLSYNNILDADSAWQTVSSFAEPTVVILKHLNPTGIASGATITEAFPHALASDNVSAFGGIVAVNRTIDDAFVKELGSLFTEVIVAPDFTLTAQDLLTEKRKNCRLLKMSKPYNNNGYQIRSVHQGILVQSVDTGNDEGTILKTVTDRVPTAEELEALQFAWKTVQFVKSNAIVLAKLNRTVGIGGGLPSRVDSVNLAVQKAGTEARGSVLASDAFFPFADGIEAAAQAGITAIIQPGKSIRDNEVIAAANNAGIAMVFTGTRHFRH